MEVVTPVGAGDAFAAGFLSGTLRGLPLQQRLRHGHLAAAAALTVPGDLAEPPRQELSDRLAALSDQEWGGLHLGPGWPERGGPQQEPPPAGSRAHGVQHNDPAQPNTREVGAP